MKWHQESSTPIGHQNLFTCGVVRTSLTPIHIPNSDTKAKGAGKTPCHMRAKEATSIASDQEDLSLLLKNKEIPSLPPILPSALKWEENFRDQDPFIGFSTPVVAAIQAPLPVTTTMYQCLKDAGREGDWQSFAAFPIITRQGRQNPVHESLPYKMFKDLKKSKKDNGLQSPYTVGLLTAMTEAFQMAP